MLGILTILQLCSKSLQAYTKTTKEMREEEEAKKEDHPVKEAAAAHPNTGDSDDEREEEDSNDKREEEASNDERVEAAERTFNNRHGDHGGHG
jgi:glucan-binding YG repeat protein